MPATSTHLDASSRRFWSVQALVRHVGPIIAGSLLMAIAAHVAVPFWPVPLTLQSLVMLGLGAALGPRSAPGAILAWIAAGAVGLPVFAAGSGAGVLAGPTAGFILGFVPAAMVAGAVAGQGRRRHPLTVVALFLAADAALFACGMGWLAGLMGWDKAVAVGLTPFLIGEALKIGLATAAAVLPPWRARRT